jgi:hypothetical protein
MTDDEKLQRIIAEKRHEQIISALLEISLLLKNILEEVKEKDKTEEKKEGE